ncbi:MAG: GNAT family N-acetyltransferase [Hamadaea sp.]|nr:GNAT family N-acetyltransferase [Hamadaea sp.]
MLKPTYPIYTARLTLRPYVMDDFDDHFAIQSNPEVTRYLYWETRDEAGVREDLQAKLGQTAIAEVGDRVALAVVWREVERVVGGVVLSWLSREDGGGEIGYVFNPEFGGKGLATEAAGAMLRLAFTPPVDGGLGLHRVIGRLDGRNTPSARVLERLGMRREAHFVENEFVKGEWTDELVYAMLESEWLARRTTPPRTRAAAPSSF